MSRNGSQTSTATGPIPRSTSIRGGTMGCSAVESFPPDLQSARLERSRGVPPRLPAREACADGRLGQAVATTPLSQMFLAPPPVAEPEPAMAMAA